MEDNRKSDTMATDPTMVGRYDDPPSWLLDLVKDGLEGSGLTSWIPSGDFASSALVRVPRFPTEVKDEHQQSLSLSGVRNEQQSAQLAVISSEKIEDLRCTIEGLEHNGSCIPSENISVRFVGYVPVKRGRSEIEWSATIESVAGNGVSGDRSPDLVGDPLLERNTIDVPELHAQPIWFTIDIPEDIPTGTYSGQLKIHTRDHNPITYKLEVTVTEPILPKPSDYNFHLDFWMNPSAIASEYDVEPWSPDHWTILSEFFEDLSTRNQTAVTTTIVENPWPKPTADGYRSQTYIGYESMVEWYYDGQDWTFDFSVFDQYVEAAFANGVGPRIHAFSILSFRGPERLIYTDKRDGQEHTEEVELGGEQWTEAWTAFLTDFSDHLRERGWLKQTWLAIDEQPEEDLETVMALLDDVAPAFKDQISVSGSLDAAPFASDLSVNTLYVPTLPMKYERSFIDEEEIEEEQNEIDQLNTEIIESRRSGGKTTTFYVAGTPSHPNLFSFSPAIEARMLPWITAENGLDGLLRWSYTNWTKDVFSEPVFNFIQGGEYIVYPGADGPLSSIRWELLKEGIEDYELLEVAKEKGIGISNDLIQDAMLLATKDVDGREKDLSDIIRARTAVIDAITSGPDEDLNS